MDPPLADGSMDPPPKKLRKVCCKSISNGSEDGSDKEDGSEKEDGSMDGSEKEDGSKDGSENGGEENPLRDDERTLIEFSAKQNVVEQPNDDELINTLQHYIPVIDGQMNQNLDGKDVVKGNGNGSGRVYPKSIMFEAVAQLQLDWLRCYTLATLKCEDEVVHSVSDPTLFASPASDMFMLVGESYLDGSNSEDDLAAAEKSSEAESALVLEGNAGYRLANKQAEEFVALVGLKFVHGVTSATFTRTDNAVFTVSKPSVFKSPSYDLYFVFGEAKIGNYEKVVKTPRVLEDFYDKELEFKFPPDDVKKLMDAFEMGRPEALECLDCFDGDVIQALAYNSVYRESMLAGLDSPFAYLSWPY